MPIPAIFRFVTDLTVSDRSGLCKGQPAYPAFSTTSHPPPVVALLKRMSSVLR